MNLLFQMFAGVAAMNSGTPHIHGVPFREKQGPSKAKREKRKAQRKARKINRKHKK